MDPSPEPNLIFLHRESTLNQVKLEIFRRMSTGDLKASLAPGRQGCLKTRPDGTILDGHHRIRVLAERGEAIHLFPREIIEKAMSPELYWIDGPWRGRLAVAARPRGGEWLEDEASAWRAAGVDVMVSLLERDEAAQLNLAGEYEVAESKGIDFISFPIPDRGLPSPGGTVLTLFSKITEALANGKNVAVHCRQSVGRSGLIAAGALIRSGIASPDAIQLVTTARGVAIPETNAQLEWLCQLPSGMAAESSR